MNSPMKRQTSTQQAIHTTYYTTASGQGKVRAKAYAGTLRFNWQPGLNVEQNHIAAALLFAQSKDWNWLPEYMVSGGDCTNACGMYHCYYNPQLNGLESTE